MELRNEYMIVVGIVILLLVIFLGKKSYKEYKDGKKFVGMSYIEDEPYFKKKVRTYGILCKLLVGFTIIAIGVSFLLLARPYKKQVVDKEKYNRDIILCLDISYSVDELNLELVDNLKETVNSLKGERFGIMIFNCSAVMLSPLTDDYEYIINTLDELKKSIAYRLDEGEAADMLDNENWFYLSSYIVEGTLGGNEDRGSSLIGDGLATSVYNFPNLEEERTRIVILSTDNDLQGTPLVTLSQAADLCIKNNVVVYGIGTNEMLKEDIEEMEAAVLKTGGSFYLQEKSGTVEQIVQEIEKKGKNLVKGKKEIREVELVEIPAIVLFGSIFIMLLFMKITKVSEQ